LDDIAGSFKWMWHPKTNTIVICATGQNHSMALKSFSGLSEYDFLTWIRFVHIMKKDYEKADKDIICVRSFDEALYSESLVRYMLSYLKITDDIEFNVTNERLQEITKNYNENF